MANPFCQQPDIPYCRQQSYGTPVGRRCWARGTNAEEALWHACVVGSGSSSLAAASPLKGAQLALPVGAKGPAEEAALPADMVST